MVCRITYNVYRLNTVSTRNVIQGLSMVIPLPFGTPLLRGEFFPFNIVIAKQF